jgi:hypothetical protein
VASAAVLSVLHVSHEDTGTAGLRLTLSSKSLNLSVIVNLVEVEDSKLVLLSLVLDLLGGGVDLLLSLLTTTSKSQDEMESGLLLDVVVRKGSAVLELLTGEDKSLLVRGNSLLVLDLGLDVVDGVGRLHLEGDSLTGKGLDKNLHFGVVCKENCAVVSGCSLRSCSSAFASLHCVRCCCVRCARHRVVCRYYSPSF